MPKSSSHFLRPLLFALSIILSLALMEEVIFKALSCQNTASGFCYIILHISALYFKYWQPSYWTHLLQYGELSGSCGHTPWCHLTTCIPICEFAFWHLACTLFFPSKSLAVVSHYYSVKSVGQTHSAVNVHLYLQSEWLIGIRQKWLLLLHSWHVILWLISSTECQSNLPDVTLMDSC